MPKKYERTTEDTADQDEHDNGRGSKNQRVIQWVTHAQKVALVRNDNLLFSLNKISHFEDISIGFLCSS